MEKEDYIKKYKAIYKDIPKDKQKKAKELIERASDISIIIDDAQEHIAEEGSVTKMIQGSYFIMRENPYSKIHDAKMKSLLAVLDRLDKLLPDSKVENVNKAGEALAKFVAGGKKVEVL